MTVASTNSKAGPYAGAGTTGPFAVDFRFLEDSHLQVIRTSAAGVATTLTLTTDYTVTGAGGTSGEVTLVAALAAGETLAVLRNVPATQETDYVQNDAFPAESHERALDKLTMIAQQQGEILSRAITVPTGESGVPSLPAAADRANTLLGFDSNGDPTVSVPVTGTAADVLIQLADTTLGTKNSGLVGYRADLSYAVNTAGRELRRWLTLDHFVSDTTGVSDVAAGINNAVAAAVEVGAVGIYGTPGKSYRIQSKVDLTTARNLTIDFRGATLIDDVRVTRPDMSGRGDHAFLLYGNSGVEVCNLNYQAAATRVVAALDIPSIAFWIGGQNEGGDLTRWARVRNVVATTPIVGMMFASVLGEAAGVEIENIELTGRWSYGTNFEYGDVPVDPATNNTITNGQHPYNCVVRNLRGFDLIDCLGFLRTASCYSVKFENCQGSNVRNFFYGYVGDRNISRFSQNVIIENCKTKGESAAFLAASNYDVQIISVNEDGSTGVPLPAWTNYRHMFRFVNCEFQSGTGLDSASVRFFGNKGKVVFDQCIFRDSYFGLRAEPSANPDYTSSDALTFRDCLFVNNYQHVHSLTCEGVVFNNTRFEDQNTASTLVPVRLQNSNRPVFNFCQFTGKATGAPQYHVELVGCARPMFSGNRFTLASIAHYAITSDLPMYAGVPNDSNGLLTANTLTTYGIVGENRSMTRDLSGLVGGALTFERGNHYANSTTETVGRFQGGQIGDEMVFRADGGGSNCTFQHVFAGVPTLERLINKSGVNDTVTGANWSRRYMKFNDGWREL
ncbi:MAG: phD2B [Steroidobacteraceae bacterium]|jgi:hypothetical protein|nr:phD2B [Steroidobacteraceae bacterium]